MLSSDAVASGDQTLAQVFQPFFKLNQRLRRQSSDVQSNRFYDECFERFFHEPQYPTLQLTSEVAATPAQTDALLSRVDQTTLQLAEQTTVISGVVVADSLVARLKMGMSKTRSQLTRSLTELFASSTSIDQVFFDGLEMQLIQADVGVDTTTRLVDELKIYAKTSEVANSDQQHHLVQLALKTKLKQLLDVAGGPVSAAAPASTHTTQMILVLGVNGVGKTTTIGKLAYQAQSQGKKVMLAAGDTFRAAAVEQLQIWGKRADVAVISQGQGADSASVIYDALQSAKAKHIDILIADTAGRLHNKTNLMKELQKIVRVVKKVDPCAPHRVLLVLDGCTGQNALSQGREFNAAVPLTGLVVTKLDGTAKGGIIFSLSQALGVPVDYIGIGEGIDDLKTFDPNAYVDALLDFET